MYILGISAFYHDSAACLIKDGEIIAAAQEERFTRIKQDESFPIESINYCLKYAGINSSELGLVVFYDKPFLKFERIIESYLTFAPKGLKSFMMAMPIWLKEKFWIKEIIRKNLNYNGKILFTEHHQSHAASSFFPSPFKEAAFLTLDGVGEWTTTSYGIGKDNKINILAEIKFPHSLGLLYSAFTYYTGFKVNSGEYKLMGLAPYGEPKYKELILSELIDLKEDGSYRLNLDYFDYCVGLTMTNDKFNNLFGGEPRKPESKLTQKEMDLARSIQEVTEEVILRMANHLQKKSGMQNLCLAGGVALNCVANGKLLKKSKFKKIWIQPAAGDAGGALGAALVTWFQYLGNKREVDGKSDFMKGSLLGPEYSNLEIEKFLKENKVKYAKVTEARLYDKVADLIAKEKVIGWFQDRMEFGPRALGARSIIGDARSSRMQEIMNLKIKYRESFRPFAPAILREKVSEYFEMSCDSPYMLLVANVTKKHMKVMTKEQRKLFGIEKLNIARSDIPAVTHVDYSARIQTVSEWSNPRFYNLIKSFNDIHSCPVIINTSFNVRGEPIVNTLDQAYRCFMRTDMDYLVIGNYILDKMAQNPLKEDVDWRKQFTLD